MLRNILRHVYGDSLYRNSIYLMVATAVMAGFGFFFWLIVARLFSTADIGLATALISVMNLVTYISLLGFNAAFVRFLPRAENRDDNINTGMSLVFIAALVLSVAFVLAVPIISPRLLSVVAHPLATALFIFACIMASLNTLTDAVFLAQKQTKFTLIINTIFSAFKMILPFAFIPWGALGIFAAAAFAQAAGLVLSIAVMIWKFDYHPAWTIHMNTVARVWRYSAGSYGASIINLLPVSILPLIILQHFGPEPAAYYYVAMMIGNMLYVIPWSMTRSLFAEGSNDETTLPVNIKKALAGMGFLLVPSIAVLLFFGGYILQIFGKPYAADGLGLLRFVALAGIPVGLYAILGSLFQVKKDFVSLIIMNMAYVVSIIGISFAFLPWGLWGVGAAWVAGNAVAAAVGYVLYRWSWYIWRRVDNATYVPRNILYLKYCYLRALCRHGFVRRSILFYPEKPRWFHFIYTACHMLGYAITNDPRGRFERIIRFHDKTFSEDDPLLLDFAKKYSVINMACADVSKERVEKVFREVFGYGSHVDPRVHVGTCVRKSNQNATHDGLVVLCPTEPEPGYVYQKLIHNQCGTDSVKDTRVVICNGVILLTVQRFRSLHDRFDNTKKAIMVDTESEFRPDEIKNVLEFCRRFGLDYGELDTLRDSDDGRLYIVDANNTPAGPRPGVDMSRKDYAIHVRTLSQGFAAEFLRDQGKRIARRVGPTK